MRLSGLFTDREASQEIEAVFHKTKTIEKIKENSSY